MINYEKRILKAQVFKIYKNKLNEIEGKDLLKQNSENAGGTLQLNDDVEINEKQNYSLLEIFKMDLNQLEQMIFTYEYKSENSLKNYNSPSQPMERIFGHSYV